jgi:hypothetical protein
MMLWVYVLLNNIKLWKLFDVDRYVTYVPICKILLGDLKLKNLMFATTKDDSSVKVIDFG